MESRTYFHLYQNSLMKSCLYALLFLLSVNTSVAQTPAVDSSNIIKCGDSYYVIDKCKIRGAASISGTIVKDQEVNPGGTPANQEVILYSSGINFRNCWADFTYFYVDGIKVRGSSTLPKTAIEEVSIITGGTGDFGDQTGGIIRPIPAPMRVPKTSDKEQNLPTE